MEKRPLPPDTVTTTFTSFYGWWCTGDCLQSQTALCQLPVVVVIFVGGERCRQCSFPLLNLKLICSIAKLKRATKRMRQSQWVGNNRVKPCLSFSLCHFMLWQLLNWHLITESRHQHYQPYHGCCLWKLSLAATDNSVAAFSGQSTLGRTRKKKNSTWALLKQWVLLADGELMCFSFAILKQTHRQQPDHFLAKITHLLHYSSHRSICHFLLFLFPFPFLFCFTIWTFFCVSIGFDHDSWQWWQLIANFSTPLLYDCRSRKSF